MICKIKILCIFTDSLLLSLHRIDSEHNKKVVGWVAAELQSSEYSTADVKSERVDDTLK